MSLWSEEVTGSRRRGTCVRRLDTWTREKKAVFGEIAVFVPKFYIKNTLFCLVRN